MVFGYTIIPMALFSLLFSVSVVSNRPKMQVYPRTEDREQKTEMTCAGVWRDTGLMTKSQRLSRQSRNHHAQVALTITFMNTYKVLFWFSTRRPLLYKRRFRVAGLHVQLRVLQDRSLRRLILWSLFSGTSALSCNAVYFVVPWSCYPLAGKQRPVEYHIFITA